MTELTDFVRWYDGAFAEGLCDSMINAFEQHEEYQILNGREVKPGLEGSQWTEMDLGKLSKAGFQDFIVDNIKRYKGLYEDECGISPRLPPPSALAQLILKRYQPGGGEGFQPHFDSVREVSDRYLVFLWYLNDVEEGGETAFVDLDVKVRPIKGRLLIFPPFWMYRHAGLVPVSGPKYILSTYLLW